MTTPAATDPLTDQKNPLISCHLTDKEVETALFTEAETDETVETASKNPSPCLSFAVSASEAVAATDETAGDPAGALPPTNLPTDRPDPQCFTRETLPASANVRENGERTNASPKMLSSIGENERSRPLNARERTNAADSDLEVQVTCPRCGAWRRVPPDTLMLTDPRCPVCGEVMRPEPEDHPPTPPADAPQPVPRPSSLPDGIACQCGGRLRAIGREYLCDHCQRPLPVACQHCYRVLFVVADGRAVCATCQVAYAFHDGWREVTTDAL